MQSTLESAEVRMHEGCEARFARMDEQLKVAIQGVANFRTFQADARDFFSRFDEREKQRDKDEKEKAAALEERNKTITRRLNWVYFGLGIIMLLISFYTFAAPLVRRALSLPVATKHEPALKQQSYNKNPVDAGIPYHP